MPPPVDWSSLLPDLVSRVGDIFLATGDIDYYVNLRAVCSSWRAATDDPRGPSTRFRPRQWVMLDDLSTSADSRLFLNIHTGRFLWKELPLLNRDYTYIGADDGLLVLELVHMYRQHICILNPFTGSTVCFPSTRGSHRVCSRVAMAAERLFVFSYGHVVCYDLTDSSPMWLRGDPSIEALLRTAVSFQGRVYGANMVGSVMVVDCSDVEMRPEITVIIHNNNGERGESFLVDNDEELLLVHVSYKSLIWRAGVFKVDLEAKSLISTKSIGNRAIFLGRRCCLSVNADPLHGIEGNCIYGFQDDIGGATHMYRYYLGDGSREVLAVRPLWRGPLSLVQLILEHCFEDRC